MHLLQMNDLPDFAVKSVAPSFDHLPKTDHKDGKYRLRRYSVVELMVEPKFFKLTDVNTFTQSDKYNNFQGNVTREFENLDEEVLESEGFREIVYLFRTINKLSHGTQVDIHQMRIITFNGKVTQVSPEGVHRDGYDFIAMIGISRYNIKGGHLLVYNNSKEQFKGGYLPEDEPFVDLPLDSGKMVCVDDRRLWHNATDITPVDCTKPGYMDSLILTAEK